MTTIIILSIVAVLVVIGATQRKNIALLIKGEVKAIVDKQLNSVKVLNVRIEDIRKRGIALVDQAATLRASEESQARRTLNLRSKLDKATLEAIAAKKENNKSLSITKLAMTKELKEQIILAVQNNEAILKQRLVLESTIDKIKTKIARYTIQVEGLQARQATNEILNKLTNSSMANDGIEDAIGDLEGKVSSEEIKLDYKVTMDSEDQDDDQSDLDEEYENL